MPVYVATVKQKGAPGWWNFCQIKFASEDGSWVKLSGSLPLCSTAGSLQTSGSWSADPPDQSGYLSLVFTDANDNWVMNFDGVNPTYLTDFTQNTYTGKGGGCITPGSPSDSDSPDLTDLTWVAGPGVPSTPQPDDGGPGDSDEEIP